MVGGLFREIPSLDKSCGKGGGTPTLERIIQLALVYVPALQPIFETVTLAPQELSLVPAMTPVPFVAVEIGA